jgi:ligand-binding SRPBCC domain-containing protein
MQLSRPDLGLTVTSAPDVVQEGSQLDFQIITFGQVVKSTHRIVKLDHPTLVIEEQVSGPMRSWKHRHEYEAAPGGAIKRDIVDFQLPGGLLGLLLSESKVRDYLDDGFFYREQRLQELIQQGRIA